MKALTLTDGLVTTTPEAGKALVLDAEWVRGSVGTALEIDADAEPHVPFAAIAARAVAAADGATVAVTGAGMVAHEARRLLTVQHRLSEADAPEAIVETTGRVEAVAAALERVATLGIVVLAGEPLDEPQTLDVYPDIHVRGIRVRGVPSEPDLALADPGAPADGGQVVTPGEQIAAGSLFVVLRG